MNTLIFEYVARFNTISAERMADLPVFNHALQVEAVDFQPWGPGWIGVLITPWFMNVILLPNDPEAWQTLVLGQKVTRKLPFGEQEFMVGEEEELGKYQFRSLHSPMFRFKSQESARKTATAALGRLMNTSEVEVQMTPRVAQARSIDHERLVVAER